MKAAREHADVGERWLRRGGRQVGLGEHGEDLVEAGGRLRPVLAVVGALRGRVGLLHDAGQHPFPDLGERGAHARRHFVAGRLVQRL